MPDYTLYMVRCLQLARLGAYYVAPNPMVGALLLEEQPGAEHIIGEGWHRQWGGPHAEVNCFADARARWQRTHGGGEPDYSRCTLVVSLEPCSHYGKTPPCAKMIVEKGVKRVVIGMLDPNPLVAGRGVKMLREAGIEVITGVMEQACRELNKRFVCLHERHRPYVTLKWAQTRDGYLDAVRRSADEGGPVVISTPLTKQLVHRMRAMNMAIMVGTNTAVLDNPGLNTTRWPGNNPVRVVVDRQGRIPGQSKIFDNTAPTIVYSDRTDWAFILSDLAARGIHSVMVEGGAALLTHIIGSGIYDEVHVEIGDQTLPAGQQGVPAPYIKLLYEKSNHYSLDGHLLVQLPVHPA